MSPIIRQIGFSLVELLVVIALMGGVLAIAGTSLVRNLDGVKISRASKDVVAALRYTRGQAVMTRKEQTLDFNIESMTFKPPGRKTAELPDGMEIKLRTATSDIVDNTTGRIRFFPDGSSTGGRVTLIAGEREWLINIGWLTGEIIVDEEAG